LGKEEMKRICVIGAGAWGTAMAAVLAEKSKRRVYLVGHDDAYVKQMAKKRENPKFLPGYKFHDAIEITTDGAMAIADAQLILSGVPSKYLRSTWSELGPLAPKGAPIVSLTKGIENKTFRRSTEIIREYVGRKNQVTCLSGPSHAEEVAKGLPTTVTIATPNLKLAAILQKEISTPTFRAYTNRDLFGVEFSGAMKNVIALAAGINDGLGFGDNTKSALLTRGLAEIITLGCAMGAKRKTFYGMAGVGDLITTAFSPFGRNRAVGERLGKGETLEDILATSAHVAEGVETTRSVYNLAKGMKIEMPITSEVFQVLFKKKDPRTAVSRLMTRRYKGE
jgi:glycerol-3-phosphate dehydrogenase (NAD(P)+)